MRYEVNKNTKRPDARESSPERSAKPSGPIGGIMNLQRTVGNRNVAQLMRSGAPVIQRKKVSEEGYNNVFVTNYFKNTHLASNEKWAKTASLSRGDQYGRGLHNTVIEGKINDIKDKVKNADYDSDTYQIQKNQYGVGISANYWQIKMLAGAEGNVISSIDKTSGNVYVKAYFNDDGKVSVTGIDG